MKLSETMFITNLPFVDLHGYDRDSARVIIEDNIMRILYKYPHYI